MNKSNIIAMAILFSLAIAIAQLAIAQRTYEERFEEYTKYYREKYNRAIEEVKKASRERDVLIKEAQEGWKTLDEVRKRWEKAEAEASQKYPDKYSKEYDDATKKITEEYDRIRDQVMSANMRNLMHGDINLIRTAKNFLEEAEKLDRAEQVARDDLNMFGIQKDDDTKLIDSEVATASNPERLICEKDMQELRRDIERWRKGDREGSSANVNLARRVNELLRDLENYEKAKDKARKAAKEKEEKEEKPQMTDQEGIQYKNVTMDDVSCNAGILYKPMPDGTMDIEVSALATGKGIDFRRWNVAGIKLNVDGERIWPQRTDSYGVTKESASRDAAVVVFAAFGSQYERYADQAESGEVCPVTGQKKEAPQRKGGEVERAIDKAGMSAGLGLLASQAKGQITGKKSTFKLNGEQLKNIDEKDVIEISLEHENGRDRKQVKIPLPLKAYGN